MPSNPMRRCAPALMLGALVASTLVSCAADGTAAGDDQERIRLSVASPYVNDPDKPIYDALIAACAVEIDAEVDHLPVPGADLVQKFLQQLSSRTMPDVLAVDNPEVRRLLATGGFVPLSTFGLSGDGFNGAAVDAATYEGELYGLAPAVNTLGLFYNRTMLEEAGIEPPTTWDELRDAAKALTGDGVYGMVYAAPASYQATFQFLPFMWSNGGDETDLTSAEVAEAAQFWLDLIADGSVSKSVINWTQTDTKDQFLAGKAAMMLNGSWQIAAATAAEEADGLRWGVVPLPVPEAGDVSVAPLGGEIWTIPQTGDAAKQAKAAELIACVTSDERMLELSSERNTVPTKAALLDEFVLAQPQMSAFVEQIKTARSRTSTLGADWPIAAKAIYEGVQLVLTEQATADEAFARASAG